MPAKPTSEKKVPAPAESVPLKTLASEKDGALQPEGTVETAGARMREHDTAAWPVAEDRKLVGTVDQPNPDWQLGGHGHDPRTWKVGEIMKRDLVFCYEDEDCTVAQLLMDERGLHYLPVVDREMRIIGIFSRHQVAEKAEEGRAAKQNGGVS